MLNIAYKFLKFKIRDYNKLEFCILESDYFILLAYKCLIDQIVFFKYKLNINKINITN